MKTIDRMLTVKIFVPLLLLALCASALAAATFTIEPVTAPHPRLFISAAEIAAVKTHLAAGRQPWKSALAEVNTAAAAALTLTPAPYTGTDSHIFYDRCLADSSRARDLALAYIFGADDAHAQKALRFLFAWAYATPRPAAAFEPNPGTGIHAARSTLQFMWVYDLLYDHPLMTDARKQTVERWFRVIEKVNRDCLDYWVRNDYFNRQEWQNHLVTFTLGITAVGYVLGDAQTVQFALDHPDNPRDFVELIQGTIFMAGDAPCHREPPGRPTRTGEIYDRYRHWTAPNKGLQYSHLSMRLLILTADIARRNGLDFFSYTAPTGENLELPLTFYSDFYRLKDACIKGGLYCSDGLNETPRLGLAGDVLCFFEVGLKHYPQNQSLIRLIKSIDRAAYSHRDPILGNPALTHGIPLPELRSE